MFRIHHTDGDARCGTLFLDGDKEIPTPAMFLYTLRGGAVNLTPDLIQTLRPEAQALQLDVLQL